MARLVNKQTMALYDSGLIYEENHFILENESSNFKVVKVKKDRRCAECSKCIQAGSRCYTINPKNKGRRWVCFDCMPEHDTKEVYKIGDGRILYSEETDNWGRHKAYHELEQDEQDYFNDVYDMRIDEEALVEAMNDF